MSPVPRQCGAYDTWRSIDPLHTAFMDRLAVHVSPEPEARLWLAVIELAVMDVHNPTASPPPPGSERRWHEAGWDRAWLRSRHFTGICLAIGLDPDWTRQEIAKYGAAVAARRRPKAPQWLEQAA